MVDYKDAITKVKIICPKHNVFNQRPSDHLQNKGCPKCGIISSAKQKQINPTGWSITNWELKSKESKNFDSFKVYIIKCYNDNEEFYKIGRTFRKTEGRFMGFKYNYEIMKEIIFDSAINCFKKEADLKRLNKKYKYIPKINFNGKHECFYKIKI